MIKESHHLYLFPKQFLKLTTSDHVMSSPNTIDLQSLGWEGLALVGANQVRAQCDGLVAKPLPRPLSRSPPKAPL